MMRKRHGLEFRIALVGKVHLIQRALAERDRAAGHQHRRTRHLPAAIA